MKALSIYFAALLQLLGISLFFAQPEDQCSPSPTLGSWIFLVATLCLLWDSHIYPERYMHVARHWQVIFEVVAGIFLVEMMMLVIWCSIELLLFIIMRKMLFVLAQTDCIPWKLEYWFHALTTTFVSGSFLWFVLQATDTMDYVNYYLRKLKRSWNKIQRNLKNIYRMYKCERRRAVNACKMATMRQNRRRHHEEVDTDTED
ncbi:uncharacterized protein LOC133850662 [Drosophila sulfurigaster albostrigata]|uniref:uncharacterized protein LOC133850662 n=1 Tax=Drosophila sulfurigaster albostrigata TaxID=89887 RepID=UPI002D21CEDF|nr:uncharacterized protein LOC133850662 [Drosophila sulfurigaster albostrigata]